MADRDVRPELRDNIKAVVIKWLGARYSKRLGDTSNPDYFGPNTVEMLVDEIMELYSRLHK